MIKVATLVTTVLDAQPISVMDTSPQSAWAATGTDSAQSSAADFSFRIVTSPSSGFVIFEGCGRC
jgi:hypothetical protein